MNKKICLIFGILILVMIPFLSAGNYSEYMNESKQVNFSYVVKGDWDFINLTLYGGVADYVSNLPRHLNNNGGELSRADFKLQRIDDEIQREFLMPLVVEIQNKEEDKLDQARIAISLVQNIPYGSSDKIEVFRGINLSYSRYPYEVLYDYEGICEERVDLLAFLLREIGFEVVSFYYSVENHEALGIKCPVEYSLEESGYCFVETTGPAILSDGFLSFEGVDSLSPNPEIAFISEGDSLPEKIYEYRDAKRYMRYVEIIKEGEKLNFIQNLRLKFLKNKYGIN